MRKKLKSELDGNNRSREICGSGNEEDGCKEQIEVREVWVVCQSKVSGGERGRESPINWNH